MTDYKQNPQPRQRYDITLTIANAPGPFASLEGFVQQDVVTPECLPKPDRFSGMPAPTPSGMFPIAFTQISDTEYIGTVYTDMMIDEDYHGEGVCHWQLIQAGVRLKATGAEGETRFLPSLSLEELVAGKTKSTYFPRDDYPRVEEIENYRSFGQPDRSKISASLSGNDLFAITLKAKEVQP